MKFFSNIITNILGLVLYLLFVGICRTVRVNINNLSGKALFDKEHFIFAIWHKNTFLPFYLYRNQNIAIFVSDDLKGKILGISAKKLGFDPFTLKGNHARSTIKMRKKIEGRQNIVMAVDGPKGPAMEIKNGTQYFTSKTGVPTIAVGVDYAAAIRLFWRWDKYQVPLPFSRSTVSFSTMFHNNSDWKELPNVLGH